MLSLRKSHNNHRRARIAAIALLFVATTTPAYAYIDPGTGAMFIQMAAASVAGALFYFRSAVGRIGRWFTNGMRRSRKE